MIPEFQHARNTAGIQGVSIESQLPDQPVAQLKSHEQIPGEIDLGACQEVYARPEIIVARFDPIDVAMVIREKGGHENTPRKQTHFSAYRESSHDGEGEGVHLEVITDMTVMNVSDSHLMTIVFGKILSKGEFEFGGIVQLRFFARIASLK